MFNPTRRRMLGLLIAASAGLRLGVGLPRASAQESALDVDEATDEAEEEDNECFDTKQFGPWTGQASDEIAGASLDEIPAANTGACDLTIEFEVNTDFDARIFVIGSPDGTPLPEDFLVKPGNRLLAKSADGTVVVDEQLCGNCTDIYDDAVSIVLPLATAPLLREEREIEIALRLDGRSEDCRFGIDCETMREALDWAAERRDELAQDRDRGTCTAAGCFITAACCETLGLSDDCFELRTLRRYRDEVLAKQPDGDIAIARYYVLAPRILEALRNGPHDAARVLLWVYGRFVLPAALAARFGLNGTAYRIYKKMLFHLAWAVGGNRHERSRPYLLPRPGTPAS